MESFPLLMDLLQDIGLVDARLHRSLSLTSRHYQLKPYTLLQLIENEITTEHGLILPAREHFTEQEAYQTAIQAFIASCKEYYRLVNNKSVFHSWLNREGLGSATSHILCDAADSGYDVMLRKMLKQVPKEDWYWNKCLVSQSKNYYSSMNDDEVYDDDLFLPLQMPLLHWALNSNKVAVVNTVLQAYPAQERLSAIQYINQGENLDYDREGNTALHHAARCRHIEALRLLLNMYPQSEHYNVLMTRNALGNTVIQQAVYHFSYHESIIAAVLELLPDRLRYLSIKQCCNNRNESILQYAARAGKSDDIQVLLNYYPREERLMALSQSNKYGLDIIYYLNNNQFLSVLGVLPYEQRLGICKRSDSSYGTVLNRKIRRGKQQLLQQLHSLLSAEDWYEVVQCVDRQGCNLLQAIASDVLPDTIDFVLKSCPEDIRIALMIHSDDRGQQLFHHLAYSGNKNGIIQALSYCSEQQGLMLLRQADSKGDTVLHISTNNYLNKGETFLEILNLFPEQERLTALLTANHANESVIQKLLSNHHVNCSHLELATAVYQLLPGGQLLIDYCRQVKNVNKDMLCRLLTDAHYQMTAVIKFIKREARLNQLASYYSHLMVPHAIFQHAGGRYDKAVKAIKVYAKQLLQARLAYNLPDKAETLTWAAQQPLFTSQQIVKWKSLSAPRRNTKRSCYSLFSSTNMQTRKITATHNITLDEFTDEPQAKRPRYQ